MTRFCLPLTLSCISDLGPVNRATVHGMPELEREHDTDDKEVLFRENRGEYMPYRAVDVDG